MQEFLILAGLITSAVGFMESFDNFMKSNCTNDEFMCNNLQCIALTKHCDDVGDCTDHSDEINCDIFHCKPPHYFRCKNLRCLSSAFVCDQENDCADFSDEEKCEDFKNMFQQNAVCEENQWQCTDKLCIHMDWVCDGKPDCLDASDEILGCSLNIKCDGFKCKNGHCIPSEWKCDTQDDCRDGSDEINCVEQIQPENCTIETGHFLCGDDKTCIPLGKVCDKTKNCPDLSDEGSLCNISCTNKNCSHKCIQLPTGPKCICPEGYRNMGDQNCQDINECETYGICDQKCRNYPGSYECFCDEHYRLESDKKTCKSVFGEGVIFFSSKKDIRAYLLKSELYFPVVKNLKQAIGVDFDGEYVYWTEIFAEHESIARSLKDGTDKEILVTSGLGAPEDLHVDWWTGNIYFTDAENQHIGVCTRDGRHCTVLVNKDIHKPRGIVLNPKDGEMYWSDWGKRPEIARAFMDGSNDTSFVSVDIHWPNGLTIDYPNSRLYWTDAKIMTLESIKLDGTDRRIVLQGVVKHPYAISVFENRLYWSDWATHSIQSCEKFTGKHHQTLIKETKNFVYDITIYHSNIRNKPRVNPCTSSFCSDICLLRGSSYTCACPQNKILSIDRHTCKEVEKKQKLILGSKHMLIHIEHQLLGRHEITALPIYIKKIGALAYNSIKNVLYISDLEMDKIISLNLQSGSTHTLEINGLEKVIAMDYDHLGNNLYWCDSSKGTVEVTNMDTYYRKVLISNVFGEVPHSIALIPEKGVMFVAFQKSSGHGSHIDRFSMDGSERIHSIEHGILGPINLFYDKDLQRVFLADAGTGNIESTSIEGDDRHGFRSLLTSPVGLTSLKKEMFWINRNSNQIYWADKYNTADNDYNKKITMDLQDVPEQMHIVSITSQNVGFSHCQQNNGNCSHLCLLSKETVTCVCPIGMTSDKYNKSCSASVSCNFNEFRCQHSNDCIPNKLHCDGVKNCPNGEDEEQCNILKHCSFDEFRCQSGECIKQFRKCDKSYDCKDKSDEHNCTQTSFKPCPPKHFRCGNGQCIPEHSVCNGIYDCVDHEDEMNCIDTICRDSEFRCTSGSCIPKSWECDGDYDCADMSDEHNKCSTCSPDMFTCTNGNCIDKKFKCDQENDCGDNSDEDFCLKTGKKCNSGEFSCYLSNNICVPRTARCNGISECPHNEDEQNCSNCHPEEFRCNNNKCIPKQWICDSVNDCDDHSDETSSLCSSTRTKSDKSQLDCDGGYLCNNGKCVDYSLVCNGKVDCYDASDEGGACNTSCGIFNNPCEQICVKTPKGPVCDCRSGYHLHNNTCQDIDECKQYPPVCNQLCHNIPGSYVCDCYDGFILKADGTSCKTGGHAMSFIYTYDNQIREMTQKTNTLKLIYSENAYKIIGFDVDVKTETIYFTTDNFGYIYRINRNTSAHERLAVPGQPGIISLDWIRDNVYFVDNDPDSKSIGVCNFDDKNCYELIKTDLNQHVSAMFVDALNKFLFYAIQSWSMFHSPAFVIYKTNLDGSESQELIHTTNGFVTSISYDLYKKELYYIDQINGELSRVNYDGTMATVLVSNLRRPIGLNVFENYLYILTAEGIMKKCQNLNTMICNTFNLHSHTNTQFFILQESKQPDFGINPCHRHNCKGICLPGKSKYRCLCKDKKSGNLTEECEDKKSTIDLILGDVHSTQESHSGSSKSSAVVGLTISLGILAGVAAVYYIIKRKTRTTFRISMKFHNPVYGLHIDESQKSILQPGQHEYTNPVDIYQSENDKRETFLVNV